VGGSGKGSPPVVGSGPPLSVVVGRPNNETVPTTVPESVGTTVVPTEQQQQKQLVPKVVVPPKQPLQLKDDATEPEEPRDKKVSKARAVLQNRISRAQPHDPSMVQLSGRMEPSERRIARWAQLGELAKLLAIKWYHYMEGARATYKSIQ
jgi:hypothetical protein